MRLEDVAAKYTHPIIAVIGAAMPSEGYDQVAAYRLGYRLREMLDKEGTLFTGGSPGVGVDIYGGIIDYCIEKGVNDRFFTLIPEGIEPFPGYSDLAKKRGSEVNIERLGKDMAERRSFLAALADMLVVVNGSSGTLDEALKGLVLGKLVLALNNSGGIANILPFIKSGELKLPLYIDTRLISIYNSVTDLVDSVADRLSAGVRNG